MLKELYCRNYKAFGEESRFPLAPLSVLVGPNNAGKSSVLDMVRLMSSGEEGKRPTDQLNFPQSDHRLRSFKSILSGSQNEGLSLGMRYQPRISLNLGDRLSFHLADDISVHERYVPFGEDYALRNREIFLHRSDSGGGDDGRRIFAKKVEWESLEQVTMKPGTPWSEIIDDLPGKAEKKRKLWFGIPWNEREEIVRETGPFRNLPTTRSGLLSPPTGPFTRAVTSTLTIDESLVGLAIEIVNVIRHQDNKSPFDIEVQPIKIKQSGSRAASSASDVSPLRYNSYFGHILEAQAHHPPEWMPPGLDELWMVMVLQIIKPFYSEIYPQLRASYLPSFRADPKRYYAADDTLTPLLQGFRDAHPLDQKRVEEWLGRFEIGSDLRVENLKPDLYTVSIQRNGDRRYLADLGAGSAQLLPLILRLTSTNQPEVLLVEEPEANLHPNLQARLADLFVELVNQGHQVLIETHSEYLVRRLQYLIATGECEPGHTSILYIDALNPESNDTPTVQSISIDTHGQLSEPFGSGFFDQATDLMVDLFKYGSEN